MNLKDKLLILIFSLAIFLRLYDLGKIPPGLYLDEVQYGLDANSIWETGRDVYGHLLPLAFQSSGYYPPLFTYVLAPFIGILGLSAWSVRFPAALSGIFAIYFFYKLSKKLLGRKQSNVPYIAAFLISFSWVQVHLSRVSFLASFGLVFLVSGCYFFLKGIESKKFLVLSSIVFALSTFSHYGYKFVSPAIFLVLVFVYWNKFKSIKKVVFAIVIVWVLAIAINLVAYKTANAAFRVRELAQTGVLETTKQYFSSYSPKFLFISGDHYKLNHPFLTGVLPLSLIPFLIIGLYKLKDYKKVALFLLSFLIIVPIPSAFSGLGAHIVRNSALFIPFYLIASIGIEVTLKLKYGKLMTFILAIFFTFETLTSLKYYFSQYSKEYASLWGQNQRSAVHFAMKNMNRYKNIIITDNYNVMLSYWAFENLTDSAKFQESIKSPEIFYESPSKNLDGVHFLSLEQGINKDFMNLVGTDSLIMDTQNRFKGKGLAGFVENGKELFSFKTVNE